MSLQNPSNQEEPSSSDDAEIRSFDQEDELASKQLDLIRLASADNLSKLEGYLQSGKWETSNLDLNLLLQDFAQLSTKQGIKSRHSGVYFEDYTVYGVDKALSYYPTVSELVNAPLAGIKSMFSGAKKKPKHKAIISNVSGLANPGEMVLVLGRPGAGCTTFLKSLSGNDASLYTGFDGSVSYDGIDQKEFLKHFKGDLIYNPELDVHFPFLKVKETLEFAVGLSLPRTRIDNTHKKQYIEAYKNVLLTILGLTHTADTLVGNDFIRGVSGGERKRVSIAEALACRGSVHFWDNSTRGLDASTALEFAQILRSLSDHLNKTQFVTIYQASENIYNLFDKVTVLYYGKQVYFGPIGRAKQYFEEMGFECPARQSTSEFLTAVTDPNARFPRIGFESRVPRTAEEFENYWLNSPDYKQLLGQLDEYKTSCSADETFANFKASKLQEIQKFQRFSSAYTVNYWQQLQWCMKRSFQVTSNNRNYLFTQIIASVVQGLVFGSLFYNLPESSEGIFPRSSVIFTLVLTVALMGIAEMNVLFEKRPVLLKQRKYSMYHLSCESVAYAITSLPQSLLVAIFLTIPCYFLPGLRLSAGAFFIRLLFVFLASLAMSSLFQLVAIVNRAFSAAMAFGGVIIFSTLIYTSFMIQRPSMHPWFSWITWLNPMYYAFEAMLTTEFNGLDIDCSGTSLIPNGPSYQNLADSTQSCAQVGSVTGTRIVDGAQMLKLSFDYTYKNTWRNFGVLVGIIIGLNIVNAVFSDIFNPVTATSDSLMFLRGKVPDHVVMGDEDEAKDEESGYAKSSDTILDRPSEKQPRKTFDDLKSKDLFAWKNLNYTIQIEGKDRMLLNNVNGYCEPGTLTALMGESGAGKTTLLNALAQRLDTGIVTGDMLVNGNPLDASFNRRTGYVQQQDIHVAQVTVRESLIFAARLRRGKEVSDEEKIAYVDKIIDILHMNDYAHAIVGEPGAGLNVEQRKKLSIGVELVAKPSLLLFLDEPTSGLDSQSSWAITKLMRELSEAGQSILCTIHQPSAVLFEEFDRLLLLQKGGKTVYFGDIGERSSKLLSYFESNGGRKCGEHENPAEYILEVIGAGATSVTDKDWFEIWNNSEQKTIEDKKEDELIAKYHEPKDASRGEEHLTDTYAVPISTQFWIVLQRNSMTFWRNPEYIISKFFMYSFCSLFIGFTFWDVGEKAIGVRNGAFAALLMVIVQIPATSQAQEHAIHSRTLFEARERLSRTYHWSVLWITQFVNELPYLLVCNTILFAAVIFPLKTDNSAALKGIAYLSVGVIGTLYISGFSMMVIFAAVDLQSANLITSLLYTFMLNFCGIVQPPSLMPGFWKFMFRASPATYMVGNLIGSVIHDRKIVCSQEEMAYFSAPSGQTCGEYMTDYISSRGGYLVDPNSSSCSFCPYEVGDQLMIQYEVEWSQRGRNIGVLFAFVVINIVGGLLIYYFLRIRTLSFKLKLFKKKKE